MIGQLGRIRVAIFSAVAVGLAAGRPGPATAHLVSTELGPFYDGAAHPLVSPGDLLTIVALAIVAAFGGAAAGRRLVVSLAIAWTTGLVIGFAFLASPFDLPIPTAVVILLLGVAGLVRLRVPAAVLVPVTVGSGLMRGIANGAAARSAEGSWLAVAGVVTGVLIVGVLLTGGGAWLVRRRAEVVLRVAGSWIAAISLLMIGWWIRG